MGKESTLPWIWSSMGMGWVHLGYGVHLGYWVHLGYGVHHGYGVQNVHGYGKLYIIGLGYIMVPNMGYSSPVSQVPTYGKRSSKPLGTSFIRWLMENARPEESKSVFLRIAKRNGASVGSKFETNFAELTEKTRPDWKNQSGEQTLLSSAIDSFRSFNEFFSVREFRRRVLV